MRNALELSTTEGAVLGLVAFGERSEALREGPARFDSVYPGRVLGHGIARIRATLAWIDETAAALPTPPTASPASRSS
jgi:hypothetical protein